MYVRFVCNQKHPSVDAELGMFAARKDADFSHMKASWHRAHEEAFWWFSPRSPYGLYYPNLKGKLRTRNVRQSLFWFDEKATFGYSSRHKVVERADVLARLLCEAGLEARKIRLRNPGRVLWKDTKQSLINPDGVEIPHAFEA